MMVSGVATMTEGKLEDIRSVLTGTLLGRYGDQGIYLFDRRVGQQCMLSYQELVRILQERAPHLLSGR